MIFPLGTVLFLLEPKTRGSRLIYDSVSSSPRPRQPTTTISEPLRMRTGVCPRLKTSVRTVASGALSVVPRRITRLLDVTGGLFSLFFSTFTIATVVLVTPWSVDRENTRLQNSQTLSPPFHPPLHKRPHCVPWPLGPWMAPLFQPHFWERSKFP